MKTSNSQKEAIGICKRLLSYWENSNDITSPTLESDIEEEISNSNLSEQDQDELDYIMRILLDQIIKI